MLVFVLAVGSALVFSFLCSISEAVLLSVGRAQIERLEESRASEILRGFKREIDVPIAAILILNTVANTAGASVAGAAYHDVFPSRYLWVFSLTFTLSVLFFTEIIPKTLGVSFVGRLLVPVTYFVRALTFLLWPALLVTRLVSKMVRSGRHQPVTSLEEIQLLAMLGKNEGVVPGPAAGIIAGVAVLKQLSAHDVMVPRNGVVDLSGRRSLEDNLKLIQSSGHSRFPFTPSGELDDVTGIVLAKELLFHLRSRPGEPDWAAITSPALYVPHAMRLERLLQTFREERRHLALVVDEYGGVQGIVTLEDVLEELVGEIDDETDIVEPAIHRLPGRRLVCRGWAETRKVFELLEIRSDTQAVSLSGFVAEALGRIPLKGDRIEFGGHQFTVLRASARRAERIQIEPLPEQESCGS